MERITKILPHILTTQPKATTLQRPASPLNWTTTTSKTELVRYTLQENNSSEVILQTQLDEALAELRDIQAENNRLTSENQPQQHSISQLKIEIEVRHDLSTQTQNLLHDATSSLTLLNKEKKGWQDKLDSMQHKLSAAERQIRSLDRQTRHKLESRQEASNNRPNRRGPFLPNPASVEIIEAVRILNKEIHQTCVQFVKDLERATTLVSWTKHKPQVQKMLGDHLTTMMEDQAKMTTLGYNKPLMQAVLQVFMTYWCSSIIEAFYPHQECFTDLLIQLSTDEDSSSNSAITCGKRTQIIQPSTNIELDKWVQDIIQELEQILTIAGLRMKNQCASLFSSKTMALVTRAYALRIALAEKDICGDLEVVVVAPDTPFQEKWMMSMNGHADAGPRGDTDQSHVDLVVGTIGLGLQQVSGHVDGIIQPRLNMELKPEVILAPALNVNINHKLSTYRTLLPGCIFRLGRFL